MDHPRQCGAYVVGISARIRRRGSPPPVRGIPGPDLHQQYGAGITPASAGHTNSSVAILVDDGDHPRQCGAYAMPAITLPPLGSPPPVRGIRIRQHRYDGCTGITPASAGHTFAIHCIPSLIRDHPRQCGAYSQACPENPPGPGSPPPVRGIPETPQQQFFGGGITPASAGHTMAARCIARLSRDHPRQCGAYQK